METVGVGASHVGSKRENNEDAFWIDNELGVYLVTDGMGGHAGGEIASRMTVETVREIVGTSADLLARARDSLGLLEDVRVVAERALTESCVRIHREATASPAKAGMGCTATLLIVAGRQALMAHVGDSRLYLRRAGKVHQVSRDHTIAQELVASGVLQQADARNHQYAHVLSRAIGVQPAVRVDTLPIQLLPGDRFLLCSDGLADYIPDAQWLDARLDGPDPEVVVDGLIEFANESGGKDNITVVVVSVQGDDSPKTEMWRSRVTLRMNTMRRVPLFDSLSLAQHAHLMTRCTQRQYGTGDVLIQEGELLQRMVMVVRGELLITRGDARLGHIGPGSSLGATTLAHPRSARASVRAETESEVLELTTTEFAELARQRPWLGIKLLGALAGRLGHELDWATAQLPLKPGDALQLV